MYLLKYPPNIFTEMLYKAINRNIFQQCLLKYLPILFIQIFSKILSKCAIAFLHGQLNAAEIFQYQEKNTALNMRHEIDKLFLSIFSVQGVSQRYSPPLELNPKGLGKKQKYCYKLY